MLSNAFIYASVSFLTSTPRDVGDPDTDLVAAAHSFLLSITSGNGGRARYVKEIHLPDSAFRGEQYSLFQRILKSVTNLRDLRVYKLSWHTELLNLRTLFEESQWQSSPPPFMLKAFMWYGSGRLDQAGFEWFLASQTSLERLVIPSFHSPVHIPRLPRLYVIHTASLGKTRNVLETNRATHLRVGLDDLELLSDVALREVVVCVTRISEFGKLAEAAKRMPNMECLEMDTIKCSIPEALSRIDTFQGTKLRHLRFCPNQALQRWSSRNLDEDGPWDHDVIVNAFNRLPSLQYISFQLMSSKTYPDVFHFNTEHPSSIMVVAIPVEIAQAVTGYVGDKGSLANLVLVSHAFRRLAEPFLYSDVSFLVPLQRKHGGWGQAEGRPDAVLSAMANTFLCGITARGGVCARYVKRIYLPGAAFRGIQYALFRSILQSTPNLEDLQVHPAWCMEEIGAMDLQTFFTDSQSRCTIPPFALKTFAWYAPEAHPTSLGLEWFLSTQKSLERLLLPILESWSPSLPAFPRLRVLHTSTIDVAKRFREANQVTHLMLTGGPMELDAASFLNSPIPRTLSRVGALKGATKLRHLRLFLNQVLPESVVFQNYPWDYEDVVNIFNILPSLTHISVLISPSTTNFTQYYCFIKGMPRPVKLHARRPQASKDDLYEWWNDWIEDYVVVPFEPSDARMGYQGDLLSP
ncbi:hypothetical protein EYR40_007423 [Pleurotus pulmonarius]|nr:hypothetical protein EYR40_007423 [Pleurotus pulmonarius]